MVFAFHEIYNKDAKSLKLECAQGRVGCVSCKKNLCQLLTQALEPMREKRKEIEKDKKLVDDILEAGGKKAKVAAEATMEEARKAVKLK